LQKPPRVAVFDGQASVLVVQVTEDLEPPMLGPMGHGLPRGPRAGTCPGRGRAEHGGRAAARNVRAEGGEGPLEEPPRLARLVAHLVHPSDAPQHLGPIVGARHASERGLEGGQALT
jgi:hypothetical protein